MVAVMTLDPDFQCYAILNVTDRDRFTFAYYEEPGQNLPDVLTVHCFEYLEIRGTFEGRRVEGNTWEAVRQKP
jgi:hypothetical protein